MARTNKAKILPETNQRGVPYPLNYEFIAELANVIRREIRREVQNLDGVLTVPDDVLADVMIYPQHREQCRNAPAFFGIPATRFIETHVSLPGSSVTHKVTLRHTPKNGTGSSYRFPDYAEKRGPIMDTTAAINFCMRVHEVKETHRDICMRWANVYAMVTTLNRLCLSVSDILANFPALEVLVRNNVTLTGYLKSRKTPLARVTKMDQELRAEYVATTRTVTRTTLAPSKPEPDTAGLWAMDAEMEMVWPSWWRSCPGYQQL